MNKKIKLLSAFGIFLISSASNVCADEYQLYFMGGQSNMEGYGFNKDLPASLKKPIQKAMIFQGNDVADNEAGGGLGVWQQMQAGHGVGHSSDDKSNTLSDRFGPELPFAQYLTKLHPEQKIAIIKYARGGSSIANGASGFGNWSPAFANGNAVNQYDNFLTTVRNATGIVDIDGDGSPDKLIPKGIIWMQGEADAYLDWSAKPYLNNLKELMALIRATFRQDDLPVVIGKIADSGGDPKDGKMMDFIEIVHQAQQDFVEQDKAAALVTNTENYQFLEDNWHYQSENYIDLGQAFAKAIEQFNQVPKQP